MYSQRNRRSPPTLLLCCLALLAVGSDAFAPAAHHRLRRGTTTSSSSSSFLFGSKKSSAVRLGASGGDSSSSSSSSSSSGRNVAEAPVEDAETLLSTTASTATTTSNPSKATVDFWRDSGTWVIVVCYFLQGALGLSRLALNFYLKDDLHLSPSDLAALTGLATAPWVVKPLYGLVSDSTPLLGYRRKSYVALSGLVACAAFATMATPLAGASAEALIAANVVASGAVALSDVVVDSLVVEKARDEAEAAGLQSVAWSSRYVGAILASLASGKALELLGAQGCFAATALLPLLLCAAALGIDEARVDQSAQAAKGAWEEGLKTLAALKDALLSPAILRPAAFLFLWQATPNCGTAFFYFSTATVEAGGLGFDPDFLGKAAAVGSVAGLAGVGLYNAFYKEAALSTVILWTSVLSAVIGLAPLALISHANREWGLDDRVFSLGDDVVQSVLGEVGFLPLLVLAAKICPPGIEGALFAALMSIFNAGGLVSAEFGAFLTERFAVSESDFTNLAPLVVTCAASSLLPLVFLGWVREAEALPMALPPPAEGAAAVATSVATAAVAPSEGTPPADD